jgi:hypothetical protein
MADSEVGEDELGERHGTVRLFTTWLTSADHVDHAVADEEFTAHSPEPETVCGMVVLLAAMEAPPGDRCPRCVAFLAARESLRDLDERLGMHRHRRPGWLGKLLHSTLTPVAPRPRAGSRHDRPDPPAETRPGPSAGPQRPTEARPAAASRRVQAGAGGMRPVPVPTPSAAVLPAGGRHAVPSHSPSGSPLAGRDGNHSSAAAPAGHHGAQP